MFANPKSASIKVTDLSLSDTAGGLSDSVVRFCSAAQEILIVVCNDPASIADAYALIKTLNSHSSKIHSLSYNSYLSRLASGSEDYKIKI